MTVRSAPSGGSYYVDIIAWGQDGNRIFNNIFYGEGKRGGISLNSTDNLVCHNTFVGSAYAVAFQQSKAGNRVLNDIVQDAVKSFLVWPAKALPQTLDSNLYYNATAAPRWERDGVAYPTFAAYQQAAGETHSRYADPKFVGPTDAHLQPRSPGIDAGAAQQEVTFDIEGVARPQGGTCDIGAYELKVNTKQACATFSAVNRSSARSTALRSAPSVTAHWRTFHS